MKIPKVLLLALLLSLHAGKSFGDVFTMSFDTIRSPMSSDNYPVYSCNVHFKNLLNCDVLFCTGTNNSGMRIEPSGETDVTYNNTRCDQINIRYSCKADRSPDTRKIYGSSIPKNCKEKPKENKKAKYVKCSDPDLLAKLNNDFRVREHGYKLFCFLSENYSGSEGVPPDLASEFGLDRGHTDFNCYNFVPQGKDTPRYCFFYHP